RMTLFPNLADFGKKIINEQGTEVYLFEIGKVYLKSKGKYIEKRKLGIIYWLKVGGGYVHFKGIVEALFSKLGLQKVDFNLIEDLDSYLKNVYEMKLKNTTIGFGG